MITEVIFLTTTPLLISLAVKALKTKENPVELAAIPVPVKIQDKPLEN